MATDKQLRVTVLGPDPRILGGVAIFIDVMRRALAGTVQTTPFLVGRRATNKGWLQASFSPLYDAVRLASHLVQARPDVVHINPSLQTKSVLRDGLFLLVMRILGKREVFMFVHGWDEKLSARIANNPIFCRLFRYVFGWPRITAVLAGSFREQMLAMGFPPERIEVESAMFDGTMFAGLTRRPNKDRRLVFVSRLVPGKGASELLDAYALLKPDHPELSLWIVGDGSERGRLEQKLAEKQIADVTITGYVSTVEKAQILLDGDVFVLPTTYGEGCPAALLEAMAAGLPCIATRVGGIPDVLVDGENGILLGEVTPQAVAQALVELLDDQNRMTRIGNDNLKAGWSKYEAHSVSSRIADRYWRVLGMVRM